MKKILTALALALLATGARAQQLTYDAPPSTAVVSNVTVSSLTAVRVDNLVLGTTGQIVANRAAIIITIPHAAAIINCDFFVGASTAANQVNLSTQTGNVGLGAEYATTSTQSLQVSVPLPTSLGYWCQSQGTTNPVIHVQQVSPWKPGTRSIP